MFQGNLQGKLEMWAEGLFYYWSEVSLNMHTHVCVYTLYYCMHYFSTPSSKACFSECVCVCVCVCVTSSVCSSLSRTHTQQAFFLVESREGMANVLDIVVPASMVGTK